MDKIDPYYGRTKVNFCFNGLSSLTTLEGEQDLYHFTTNHFVDSRHMRDFVSSSANTFVIAQKAFKKTCPEPISQQAVTYFSHTYRGLIVVLTRTFQQLDDLTSANLYSKLDLVWSFCEIMLISSHPEYPIVPYLSDWVHDNFGPAEATPEQLTDKTNLDNIWDIIFIHTLHGKTRDAAKFLQFLNPRGEPVLNEQLLLLKELLVKRPVFSPNTSTLIEFEKSWYIWREECHNRLEQRAFYGNDKITLLCQILAGIDEAIEDSRKYVQSWFEYMVIILSYKFPKTRPMALKSLAHKARDEFGQADNMSPYEEVIMLGLEFDIVGVLKEMQNHWNHPWFAVHFAHLIYIGGKYSEFGDASVIDYSSVGPLLNEFIADYGSLLLQHSALWQVGAKYLETINNKRGMFILKEILPRIKPKTEREAHKLIQIGSQYGLETEVQGVCKVIAREKLNLGQLQCALLWSIKSGDGSLTSYIVDKILFQGDCEIETSLLDTLKNIITCTDRLLFLSGYCEFRKLIDRKEFKPAISLLCQLINDEIIPKRINKRILKDLAPAVDILDLESTQTTIIMKFLHNDDDLMSDPTVRIDAIPVAQFLVCNRVQDILKSFKRKWKKETCL